MLGNASGLLGTSVLEKDGGSGLEVRLWGGGISGDCGLDVRAPVPATDWKAGGDGTVLAGRDAHGGPLLILV